MANITAAQVNELRNMTGVGLMKCKEALIEADGDLEKAGVILREKGLANAIKKASRIAAEGVIALYGDNNTAVLCEVNSETDFVAKNEKFTTFANNLAKVIAEKNPADVEALMQLPYPDYDGTIEDKRKDMVLSIGENMNVRRFVRVTGHPCIYNHGNGKIGVIVNFTEDASAYGKKVCMQVAAMNPTWLDRTCVPAERIANEKEILVAQIKNDPKNANKPEQVLAKIAEGKLGKFYSEYCLVDQAFVMDESISVGQFVASQGSAKISEFVRFERGEGLQKREDDFAAEVAKMAQGK